MENITGYVLHSLLLVPYFSWQRSHAVHHRFTNNITNGETHVPLVIKGNGVTEKDGGEKELHFSYSLGKKNYGILQLILHLIFAGQLIYLLEVQEALNMGLQIIFGQSNHFLKRYGQQYGARKFGYQILV